MNVATALTRASRGLSVFLAVSVFGFAAASKAAAQGVTTGAARGRVVDQAGQPISGVSIVLVNRVSGNRFGSATNAQGQYYIANVLVGPYQLEARAIGYRPVRDTLTVRLGAVAESRLRLEAATVELAAIEISATEDNPLLSRSRTGAVTSVSDSLISRLPSINRNFADFLQTAPAVVVTNDAGRITIAGQHNRSNAIQIDGAVNGDMFQLNSSNGLPGGRENARPISVEAIREFQVLIAPYDVRHGGFTGGVLNAVTRSGTNQLRGSLYGYLQSDGLVGDDSLGNPVTDFTRNEYGFTLGGPIMRDRWHLFVTGDVRQRNEPFSGLSIRSDTTGGNDSVGIGIRRVTAERVQQIAQQTYGFDPGDWRAPTIENPNSNFFIKLNGQIGANSQIEASYNYVNASNDNLIRAPFATGLRDGYELSRSGYQEKGTTNSFRMRWNAGLGPRFANELLVSGTFVRQPRDPDNRRPGIFIGGDRAGTNIGIGGERFSHDNILNQNIYEITDNLTVNLGRHVLTIGTHNEFISLKNNFFPGSLGLWQFSDSLGAGGVVAQTATDRFALGIPSRYEIALPLRPGGPNVEWNVRQVGFYVQDQFSPNPRLTLTAGLRGDLPLLDWPSYNRLLDSVSATSILYDSSGNVVEFVDGIDTSNLPNRRKGASALFDLDYWLWSPRFGFNYDAYGNGAMYVRGGVGVFAGRPPYVFVSNAYSNTGVSQAQLVCSAAASIPAFTVDPDNQPTSCAVGGPPAPPTPSIVYFDPQTKYPRNLRLSLGMDRRLPWDMVGTVDFLYTRFLNQMYLTDVNLIEGGHAIGEASRQLYGSATTGNFTARRRFRGGTPVANLFNDVILNRNSNDEYAVNLSFQLQKRFSNSLEFNGSYTWSRARDFMSYGSDIAFSNLRFSPLDGTLDNRTLTRSRFDIPHQVKLSGTANLAYGVRVSLFYVGRSGLPYTYTISGDANGDGLSGNDQVYVPLNQQDISLCPPAPAACVSTTPTDPGQYRLLDNFINSQACLRNQRGRIMERNSCRDPWRSFANARISKEFRTLRGQALELSADVFNVMALLGVGGTVRTTGGFEATDMLSFQGYNGPLSRARYRLALPQVNRVLTGDSRWRMMLGARYTF